MMGTPTPQTGWWLLQDTTRPDDSYMLDLTQHPRFQLHAVVNRPIHLTADEAAVILAHPLPAGLRWHFTGPLHHPRGGRRAGTARVKPPNY